MADPITTDEEPTTTVRDALATVGMTDRPDGEVVLASITGKGIRHYTLATVGDADPADAESLYVASGLFAPGVVSIKGGRTTDHVTRVMWLPFDADLIAMLDSDKVTADDLHAATQEEIEDILGDQIVEVDRAFAACGFPLHRLDYTGYGLCAYGYVHESDQHRVADAQRTHKGMVAALNAAAGFRLFDVQVSDAGPRITRVPGSLNRKGATPRVVRTLRPWDGRTAYLDTAPTQPPAPRTPVDVPVDGDGLSAEAVDALVDAIRPSWDEGQRHAMGIAVAGLLAKAGVPETQALDIVGRLTSGDKKPYDRYNALRRSYERVRSGQAVAGYTQLQQLMPADALAFVGRTLDQFRESTAAIPDLSAFETTAKGATSSAGRRLPPENLSDDDFARSMPPVPDECFYGPFAAYRDIMAPTTQAPDVYHLASALTWFGALVGRRIRTEHASEDLYPNLFTVLVGASGSTKKDTAAKRAIHLPHNFPIGAGLRNPDMPYAINTNVSSSEGLIGDLEASPRQILYLNELSIVQKNAQRKGTRTIFDTLITAFDCPPEISNNTKSNRVKAEKPFLSMLAATQPKRLADQMTDEDIHSGFANRILFVLGAAKEPMSRPPGVDRLAAWKLYLSWMDVVGGYTDPTVIPLSPDSYDPWDEWFDAMASSPAETEEEGDMRQRLPVFVQKIALIFAISDGARAIEPWHLAPAIAFVDWCWGITRQMLKGWAIGVDTQIELAITRALQRHGPMHRRNLQMRTNNRKWSGRDFAAVFRGMTENRLVSVSAEGIVSLDRIDP